MHSCTATFDLDINQPMYVLAISYKLEKNLRWDLLCEKRKRQFSIGKTKSEREQYSDVCYHLIFGCTIWWIFAVHF